MSSYLDWPAIEIVPGGPLYGTLAIPSSKSYTNRALLLGALAVGTSDIRRPLQSDDTRHMRAALGAFGARFVDAGGDLLAEGVGDKLQAPTEPVHCGLSGTTLRFLTAVAALGENEIVLTGDAPLLRRPMYPLVDALRSLGAEIRYLGEEGCAPLAIRGPLRGGEAALDASKSSQFLTALLLAAPYAREEVSLHVTGLTARPYIEMTLQAMERFGVSVEHGDDHYTIAGGQSYRARDYAVEYDASSAAHILCLAAAAGGELTILNAAPDTLQADARFAGYLSALGCTIARDGEELTVRGDGSLGAVEFDLNDTPDMTTPLAVLCAYAEGESHLHNVEVVRGHETDRLSATSTELRKLGVGVEEERDGLRIRGGIARGARIDTYHDHRMAMSFAAAAVRTPGIVIEGPGCVAKTYPEFWQRLAQLGVTLRQG